MILSRVAISEKFSLEFFNYRFSYVFVKTTKQEINFWKKNFQENWATFNPEFNDINQSITNCNFLTYFTTKLSFDYFQTCCKGGIK